MVLSLLHWKLREALTFSWLVVEGLPTSGRRGLKLLEFALLTSIEKREDSLRPRMGVMWMPVVLQKSTLWLHWSLA